MCIICEDLDVNKLTPWEAAANRREMLSEFDEEHLLVLDLKIRSALVKYLNNIDNNSSKDSNLKDERNI